MPQADYFVDRVCDDIQLAEMRLIGTTLTLEQAVKISNAIYSLAKTMMHCVPPDHVSQPNIQPLLLLK